jgi:hypothetical protein
MKTWRSMEVTSKTEAGAGKSHIVPLWRGLFEGRPGGSAVGEPTNLYTGLPAFDEK